MIEKNAKIKILFALNKVDVIDEEYESVEEFMKTVREYLAECGFANADIVPVSAMAALLFKKVLAKEKLTKMEYENFTYFV